MSRNRRTRTNTTWLTVPVADELHGEVRSHAVKQRKDWPEVVAEAMTLWLVAQEKQAA